MLFVLTAFSTQRVVDSSGTNDGLISSYSFDRRECLDGVFGEEPGRVAGNLARFEGYTSCLNGNGVRATVPDEDEGSFRVTSTQNISRIIAELATSVEVRRAIYMEGVVTIAVRVCYLCRRVPTACQ